VNQKFTNHKKNIKGQLGVSYFYLFQSSMIDFFDATGPTQNTTKTVIFKYGIH
jgi:hypothetical protein